MVIVLVGVGGVLFMCEGFIKDVVEKVRRVFLWMVFLLVGFVIFVLGVFVMVGYVVLLLIFKYCYNMIVVIVFGGLVCGIVFSVFLFNFY